MGGKPNPGTPRDKRLKSNKGGKKKGLFGGKKAAPFGSPKRSGGGRRGR
jgi:hypothetical protein